jgi:hypothetical protein
MRAPDAVREFAGHAIDQLDRLAREAIAIAGGRPRR